MPKQIKTDKSYILMVHVAKKLYFSQRPLGIDVVVKRISNLLDRNLLSCIRTNRRATNREQE